MAQKELAHNLLAVAEEFSRVRGIKLSTARRHVGAASGFFDRIKSGDTPDFRVSNYDAMLLWFSRNWPQGAVWPSKVARPR